MKCGKVGDYIHRGAAFFECSSVFAGKKSRDHRVLIMIHLNNRRGGHFPETRSKGANPLRFVHHRRKKIRLNPFECIWQCVRTLRLDNSCIRNKRIRHYLEQAISQNWNCELDDCKLIKCIRLSWYKDDLNVIWS